MMAANPETDGRTAPVLAMFPARRRELLRLLMSDPHFRGLSDDLSAAHASLSFHLARSGSGERQEVEEYRTLIGELEVEVRQYLEKTDQAKNPRPPVRGA
jgi:hypothetical protein